MKYEQRKKILENLGFNLIEYGCCDYNNINGKSWALFEKKDLEDTEQICLTYDFIKKGNSYIADEVLEEDLRSFKTVHKVGGCEFYHSDLRDIFNQKKYVCSNFGIYKIKLSSGRCYGSKVLPNNLSAKNRFYLLSAEDINHILKTKILNEDPLDY